MCCYGRVALIFKSVACCCCRRCPMLMASRQKNLMLGESSRMNRRERHWHELLTGSEHISGFYAHRLAALHNDADDNRHNDDDSPRRSDTLLTMTEEHKPGQKHPTPTPGVGDRVFYETLLRQRPDSAMAQEWYELQKCAACYPDVR